MYTPIRPFFFVVYFTLMDNALHNVHIVDHPLVQDSLLHLRNIHTQLSKFRYHSDKICQILFYESVRNIATIEEKVTTPITTTVGQKISEEIMIVPILRSGIAMLMGAIHFLPKATVGFVGLERNEETAIASQYYLKLPKITSKTCVIVTDPMLATGGSILHLLQTINALHPKEIRVVCVIAAPEGIRAIHTAFPDIHIFTAKVDEKLNAVKYIVPGLGDYGDRYFGTTQ